MSKEFSRCSDCGKIFDAGIQPLSDHAVLYEGRRLKGGYYGLI